MNMNLPALALSTVAAGLSPEPVTKSELADLTPPPRVTTLKAGDIEAPPAIIMGDEPAQATPSKGQDPVKAGEAKKEGSAPTTPGAAATTQEPAAPAPSAAAAATQSTTQDPAQKPAEFTPQEKLDYSVAIRQFKDIDAQVYKKILEGKTPVAEILKEAQKELEDRLAKNNTSLDSLERALQTPDKMAEVQALRLNRLETERLVKDNFNARVKTYKNVEAYVSKAYKEDKTYVDNVFLPAVAKYLEIEKLGRNEFVDTMPPLYKADPDARAALTVTPKSEKFAGFPEAAKEIATVLTSPVDPNKPLAPGELRVLTEGEIAQRYEADRPVVGKTPDPAPQIKANRADALKKLTPEQAKVLEDLEALSGKVAAGDLVREVRGIPAGIEYHVEKDTSTTAKGPWQSLESYEARAKERFGGAGLTSTLQKIFDKVENKTSGTKDLRKITADLDAYIGQRDSDRSNPAR